jgi:hypothetical protein
MGMLPLVAARPAVEVMWLDLQPAVLPAPMTQAMAMLTTPRLTVRAAVSMVRLLAQLGPLPLVRVTAPTRSVLATLPAALLWRGWRRCWRRGHCGRFARG